MVQDICLLAARTLPLGSLVSKLCGLRFTRRLLLGEKLCLAVTRGFINFPSSVLT